MWNNKIQSRDKLWGVEMQLKDFMNENYPNLSLRSFLFYKGCDLLATTPSTIRDVYKKHNDWILDYNRNKIDKIFHYCRINNVWIFSFSIFWILIKIPK